jgi:RecA-family ATPase
MAEIEREIEGRQPRLVVIDSVMSFAGARTDVYRPNEVRALLAPLAKLAETHGCAILALWHIIKSKGGRAICRQGEHRLHRHRALGAAVGLGLAARSHSREPD